MYVSKCKGDGCLLSLKCKRFTSEESEQQSYFTDAPYRVIGTETKCDYFINQEDEKGRTGSDDIGGVEEEKQTT
jgi:hypothetical protein